MIKHEAHQLDPTDGWFILSRSGQASKGNEILQEQSNYNSRIKSLFESKLCKEKQCY